MFGIDMPWYGFLAMAGVIGVGAILWIRKRLDQAAVDRINAVNAEAQAKADARAEAATRAIKDEFAAKEKQNTPVTPEDFEF